MNWIADVESVNRRLTVHVYLLDEVTQIDASETNCPTVGSVLQSELDEIETVPC